MLFQRISHRDGVHHGAKHSHRVRVGALHPIRAILDAPPEIARADDQTDLHTHPGAFLNGVTQMVDNVKIQPAALFARQGLSTDFQQNTPVLDLTQVSSLLVRLSYPIL